MARFMFSASANDDSPMSPDNSSDAAQTLKRLQACLEDCDRLGASLAAVYLATAIEHLRAQFGLRGDCSKTD